MTTLSESFHGAPFARVTGLWAPGYVAYVADVGPVGPSRWWWLLFAQDKVPDGRGGWTAAPARQARGAASTRKAAECGNTPTRWIRRIARWSGTAEPVT